MAAALHWSCGVVASSLSSGHVAQSVVTEVDPALRRALLDAFDAPTTGEHLESAVAPIFQAMPKNEHGRLTSDSVWYVLNRVVSQEHGFSLGDGKGTGQQLSLLLRERLDCDAGRSGCTLGDVVMMAAIVEGLVNVYLRWLLKLSYNETGVPISGHPLSFSELTRVMEMYMAGFLQGHTAASVRIPEMALASKEVHLWETVKEALNLAERDGSQGSKATEYDFKTVEELAKQASAWAGRAYHVECATMEAMLLDLEVQQTGTLPLADFQQVVANEDTRQFAGTIEQMRSESVLDESDERLPTVSIPNYMASRSNCIARSGLTSICCPEACTHIVSQLEASIKKDKATPDEIVHVVEELPMPLPGVHDGLLSPSLLRSLNDQARLHGGRMSIHGAPFSHWLHLLSPSACGVPAGVVGTGRSHSSERLDRDVAGRVSVEEDIFASKHDPLVSATTSKRATGTTMSMTLYSIVVVGAVAVLAVGLRQRSSSSSKKRA
eukprot:TRINITY_DN75258_c0_g1_i1.p1 TRINITY_DN75258_c0_g1~~TRINITY_DN75258_c0_g1_i1.p1  ORF type:complete len:524 (-),score=71.66 TRINITY_DN75258_c0_g1_i1:122-1603(-)